MTNVIVPRTPHFDVEWIYALVNELTGEVGYVGRSKNPQVRYGLHLDRSSNNDLWEWICALRNRGNPPVLCILEVVWDRRAVSRREAYWIQEMARMNHPLCNYNGRASH